MKPEEPQVDDFKDYCVLLLIVSLFYCSCSVFLISVVVPTPVLVVLCYCLNKLLASTKKS